MLSDELKGGVNGFNRFVDVFYGSVFSLDPGCKVLFAGNMLNQGKALVGMLSVIVKQVRNLDTIQKKLTKLGERHIRYGVKPYMFFVVGRSFIEAFTAVLGDQFTLPMKDAWLEAYPILTGIMTKAMGHKIDQTLCRNIIDPFHFSKEVFQFIVHNKMAQKSFAKMPNVSVYATGTERTPQPVATLSSFNLSISPNGSESSLNFTNPVAPRTPRTVFSLSSVPQTPQTPKYSHSLQRRSYGSPSSSTLPPEPGQRNQKATGIEADFSQMC
eukprot:Pgem_evm1s354